MIFKVGVLLLAVTAMLAFTGFLIWLAVFTTGLWFMCKEGRLWHR